MTTFAFSYNDIVAGSIHLYSEEIPGMKVENFEKINSKRSREKRIVANPIISYYEQKIAEKEIGKEALALHSLREIRTLIFKNLLKERDNIVSFNSFELYTEHKEEFTNRGIEIRLSDDGELKTFMSLVDANTKFIYLETISKEYINIPDFYKIISFAKEKEIPVIVDNTSGGLGYLVKPLELGAHIVIENTNEWLHEDYGFFNAFIVEGKSFNWRKKFPHLKAEDLTEDYSIYPRSLFSRKQSLEEASSILYYLKGYRNKTKNKIEFHIYTSQLIQSIIGSKEKVLLRSKTAETLAHWLKSKEYVKKVQYTGLPDSKSYFNALRYFSNGFGNKLSFELRDYIDSKRLFNIMNKNRLLKNHISYNERKNSIHISVPAVSEEEISLLFENIYEEYINEINPYTVSSKRIII